MVIRGTIGADAVLARFPKHTRYEPMLVKAFARNKAPLVPMGCQTGALGSTSMILDCTRHLGAPRLELLNGPAARGPTRLTGKFLGLGP